MTANGIKRRRKLSQTFAQPPKSTKTALSRANMPALAGWAKTRWCPVSTPSGIESCTCQKRARAAGWCAFETAWMQWLNAASTKRTRLCSPPSQAGKTGSSFPQTSTIARVISPWMIAMSSNAASGTNSTLNRHLRSHQTSANCYLLASLLNLLPKVSIMLTFHTKLIFQQSLLLLSCTLDSNHQHRNSS